MAENQTPEEPLNLTVPANITVTLKQDKPVAGGPDWERTARIVSLVAIPVVLAIIGGVIQATLSKGTVSSDYVKLAVSILTTEKSKTQEDLREWAVDLLDANSPAKFSKEVAARLKGGEIALPGNIAAILSTANGNGNMAVTPDGQIVAIGQGNDVRLWTLSTGQPIARLRSDSPVTSVAFSPDAKLIAVGSEDGKVRLSEVTSGRERNTLIGATEAVVGLAFTPDAKLILTRSLDGTFHIGT